MSLKWYLSFGKLESKGRGSIKGGIIDWQPGCIIRKKKRGGKQLAGRILGKHENKGCIAAHLGTKLYLARYGRKDPLTFSLFISHLDLDYFDENIIKIRFATKLWAIIKMKLRMKNVQESPPPLIQARGKPEETLNKLSILIPFNKLGEKPSTRKVSWILMKEKFHAHWMELKQYVLFLPLNYQHWLLSVLNIKLLENNCL